MFELSSLFILPVHIVVWIVGLSMMFSMCMWNVCSGGFSRYGYGYGRNARSLSRSRSRSKGRRRSRSRWAKVTGVVSTIISFLVCASMAKWVMLLSTDCVFAQFEQKVYCFEWFADCNACIWRFCFVHFNNKKLALCKASKCIPGNLTLSWWFVIKLCFWGMHS